MVDLTAVCSKRQGDLQKPFEKELELVFEKHAVEEWDLFLFADYYSWRLHVAEVVDAPCGLCLSGASSVAVM